MAGASKWWMAGVMTVAGAISCAADRGVTTSSDTGGSSGAAGSSGGVGGTGATGGSAGQGGSAGTGGYPCGPDKEADGSGNCVPIDDCNLHPCLNGGTCSDTGIASYECTCITGFTGPDCEINIDDCTHNPCLNGGTCADGVDDYTCTCPTGYMGVDCETPVNNCAQSPCLHGTCANEVGGYSCTCTDGYYGDNCDTECEQGNCVGTVVCDQQGGGNRDCSACIPGFSGSACETNIDECAPNPCQNSGTCTDGINSYSCACTTGYAGTNCEINVDDCSSAPCQNGGTCTDGINSYSCSCATGYTGTNCENNIDDCSPNPCQNGGTCADGINSYTCDCQSDFSGTTCQYGRSCAKVLGQAPTSASGVYTIDPDGDGEVVPFPAYCDMTTNGGGWTLVLKSNGTQPTFHYDQALWTSISTLNPANASLDRTEAKLRSYSTVPFSDVLVGMEFPIGSGSNPLALKYLVLHTASYPSLLALILPGRYVATTNSTAQWLSLMTPSALQAYCNRGGFNASADSGGEWHRVRIGMIGNENSASDCSSHDSRIGIGGSGTACGTLNNPTGNYVACNSANYNNNAFGVVFVR